MVKERAENYISPKGKRDTQWKCMCDCGKMTTARGADLTSGRKKSCGCLQKDHAIKHGMEGTRLYRIWHGMKDRCKNENGKNYANHGGRGISICEEWCNDFQAFYDWSMENGYQDGLTIDRRDNDGNYEPSNCRWTTAKVQANNRRSNRMIEYEGESHTEAEWGEITGLGRSVVHQRLKEGWSIKKTLTEPKRRYRKTEETEE